MEIEKSTGKSSEEIILKYGEDKFRKIESEILKEFSKESGLILDCGGGIVTVEENYQLLRQNSKIIWLKRDINKLEIEGRPLSKKVGIEKLYKNRAPLYQKWADEVWTGECGEFKRN